MRRTLRLADPCEERVTCGPEPLEPVKGCQNLPSLAVYFYVSILVDLLDGMYDQTHQQQQYVVHSGYPATTRPTAGACSANIAGLTHRHGCLAPFHRQEVVHHDLKAQKKKKPKSDRRLEQHVVANSSVLETLAWVEGKEHNLGLRSPTGLSQTSIPSRAKTNNRHGWKRSDPTLHASLRGISPCFHHGVPPVFLREGVSSMPCRLGFPLQNRERNRTLFLSSSMKAKCAGMQRLCHSPYLRIIARVMGI